MKYVEFKNGLNNGQEFAIYLFEGEDAFFRESGVSLLKEKFITEPELNLVNMDSDCSAEQLVSSLEGYPFMSKKRMTLVREFYPKQDFFTKHFKEYLEKPFLESILVVVNEKTCDTLKKISNVCLVECGKADISLLIKWVKARCSMSSVNIDAETAKTLAEFCLSDMTRIKSETDKLISFVGNGGTITLNDVKAMVEQDTEYKIYELTDCVAKKNFLSALTIIKDMTNKGEPAQRLLSYIYNYFRRLLHVAISEMTDSEIAKAFGVKEYAVTKMKQQAKLFKKRALKNAVDVLSDADYKIKSGFADGEDYPYLTIFKIMTES